MAGTRSPLPVAAAPVAAGAAAGEARPHGVWWREDVGAALQPGTQSEELGVLRDWLLVGRSGVGLGGGIKKLV